MTNYWFRHSHSLSSDPKLALAAQLTGFKRSEVIAFWVSLLEYASAQDNRGSIEGINLSVISFALDIQVDVLEKIHSAFVTFGALHENRIKNWNRYNPERESKAMTGAERVRKHRENKRKQNSDKNNTKELCNECNGVTTYTNIQSKNKPLTPLNVDNSVDKLLPAKTINQPIVFDIAKHLDEKALNIAKHIAKGWDIYFLIQEYNELVPTRGIPHSPVGAFFAWLRVYTKNNQL